MHSAIGVVLERKIGGNELSVIVGVMNPLQARLLYSFLTYGSL